MSSDGGKGSTQRPRSVSDEELSKNWDSIFGRDRMTELAEKAKRERALDEMVRISQEMELYDDQMGNNLPAV
jgi:hypothetical protein